MSRFGRQSFIGTLLLLLASAGAVMAHRRWSQELPNFAYLSGWVLIAVMILLALYNMRKRLPFLSLGSSEAWLQVHVYAGFFTVVLFLIHLNFRMPTGWFESTLAWLYFLVTGSGIVGLFFTRVLPRRLATRGGEVIYEKIPALRHALRLEAEALALAGSASSAGGASSAAPHSSVIADFYLQNLHEFFRGPKYFWPHLLDSRRPLNALMRELDDVRRYLNEAERATLQKLGDLVRRKDGLDYHYALQVTLKLWLFVHLPLTYSLMIFSVLHIIIVFAFSGGSR
jgi:hypothetical protein